MDLKAHRMTQSNPITEEPQRTGTENRGKNWDQSIFSPTIENNNSSNNSNSNNPEVIIIGNGPSAVCLSYFLSGNWPYYSGNKEDDAQAIDEGLQARLQNIPHDLSLVEQDLVFLSDGLEGRSPNRLALLFDALANPGADVGARSSSLLDWRFHPNREIPHLVLGRKQVGGIWQSHNEQNSEARTKTVSLGSWMELPGMSLSDWLIKRNPKCRQTNCETSSRASLADISSYYREYVRRQNLSKYFRNFSTVTSLTRLTAFGPRSLDCESGEPEPDFESRTSDTGEALWEVCGYRTTHDEFGQEQREEFRHTAPNVVLATGGFDIPLTLRVPGESLPFVVHSLHDLERRLGEGGRPPSPSADPMVVVGGGLTAADAILMLGKRKIPTIHIHRKGKDQGVYQQLVPTIYPEYHDVYRMMNSECPPEWYTAYTSVDILGFTNTKDVILRCQRTESEMTIKASLVAVLVGSRPDLTFICPSVLKDLGVKRNLAVDGKQNLVDVCASSYETVHHPGLYAMGPLVGDQMVRFIRGGALAITSHIWSKRSKSEKSRLEPDR